MTSYVLLLVYIYAHSVIGTRVYRHTYVCLFHREIQNRTTLYFNSFINPGNAVYQLELIFDMQPALNTTEQIFHVFDSF